MPDGSAAHPLAAHGRAEVRWDVTGRLQVAGGHSPSSTSCGPAHSVSYSPAVAIKFS